METQEQTYLYLATPGGTYYAPDYKAIAGLAAKIAKTMGSIGVVTDDAKHGQGFTYTSWDEAAAKVAKALTTNGLAFTVNRIDHRYDTPQRVTVNIALTITDTSNAAMLTTLWTGEGADIAKATTSGVKTWLTKTFLLSDKDADTPHINGATQPQSSATATTKAIPAAGQPVASHTGNAKPTIDNQTGEITPPAANATTPPPADATNGVKLTWLETTRKAAGWTPTAYAAWLQDLYHVKSPTQLTADQLTEATAAMAADASKELQP